MKTVDTKLLVAVAILAILVLIAAWHLTGLPPGVTWWQAWPFR